MLQIRKSGLTISFLLAALAGVALAEFFTPSLRNLALILILPLSLFFLRKKFPLILFAVCALIGILFGLARVQFAANPDPHALDKFNDLDKRVEITGVVIDEPDRRRDHAKYTLEVSAWSDGIVEKNVSGRVLIKTNLLPEYFYGDELQIAGRLKTPFESEEFSYRDYLDRFGIGSVMYYPSIEKISGNNRNPLFAWLFRFKKSFEEKINQIFPEPAASLEAGLLIGSRRGIPDVVLEDFNTTGLTHIIAISGYNISLVIAFITALFGSFVPRRLQFPLAIIFVTSFTLLVGAGPAVVRAAIMGLLAFFALTSGRQYHVGLAFVLTAAVMVFWNPKILLHDVSFQLSFAAVAGLLFVSPLFEKIAEKIPNKFAIRESLLLTLSAQVTAVPLIVFYFGRLSLVAPFANLFVAPAIPLAMLVGFIAVGLGAIFLPAGLLVGFIAYGLLEYILFVAEKLAQIPLASVEAGNFGITAVVVYYLLLAGFLIWKNRKNKQ
ncbi:MAG: ComEC family competence protein [Candidatus Peribacteraceae bacterium]|nr:ComEC family competence protein [Candidatus Peribacteraceae bacterium]